jgi:Xaa-Pro aminopeptidase
VRAEESARRLAALRRGLVDLPLDGLLVTTQENVRYLSGFSGSLGYLVVTSDAAEIVGDSRYWLQMEAEAPAFTLDQAGPSGGLLGVVAERLKALHVRQIGFESQQLTVDQHQRLRASLPAEVTLTPTIAVVENIRTSKTSEEIALLRRAAGIASRAFDRVREAIRPGLRERDVAFLLEQTFRELGADGPAFETIVAAGERGALPHGRASDRVIDRGDMVVVDFGARAGGYNSDVTRTVVVGEPTAEQRRVIAAVAAAQAASLALMKPGATADAVDRRAREALTGERHAFAHGLGHGVGLDVHERPYLSASDHTSLAAGMVITNEPGIYVPGWGGVRLEDMVLVTEGEPEVLTTASHEIAIA